MVPYFDPTINTIWCDLDGVLVDFDRLVLEGLGRTFSHQAGPKGDSEMWDFLMKQDRLYYNLHPTPYAKRLWDEIVAVGCDRRILTAIPRRTRIANATEDKMDWVQKKHKEDVFSGDDPLFIIGPFSGDKHRHCRHGDILIDDRMDNIDAWLKAGGIGILHNYLDVEHTIKWLRFHTRHYKDRRECLMTSKK